MLAQTEHIAALAERWLAQFEHALRDPGEERLAGLFRADCHWRDALALIWASAR